MSRGARCYVPGCAKTSVANPEVLFHEPRDSDTKRRRHSTDPLWDTSEKKATKDWRRAHSISGTKGTIRRAVCPATVARSCRKHWSRLLSHSEPVSSGSFTAESGTQTCFLRRSRASQTTVPLQLVGLPRSDSLPLRDRCDGSSSHIWRSAPVLGDITAEFIIPVIQQLLLVSIGESEGCRVATFESRQTTLR
ncbi:uncharacterized protein LOC135397785 [Ornithodoros turicata]|uniref:uncharacterized protein LOC135397785 n=1 Tax=Ornithodoros turicata TaxID=34597 RepID=UPI003138B9C4